MFITVGLYEVFLVDTDQAKELFYARAVANSPESAIAQVQSVLVSSKPINFKAIRFFTRCIGTWTDTSPMQLNAPVVIPPPQKKGGKKDEPF